MAWKDNVNRILVGMAMPVSMLLLLTGHLWLSDHGRFPKLFMLVLLVTLGLLVTAPRATKEFIKLPIVAAYLALAAYFSLSIAWSTAEDDALELLKRPLQVLTLFFALFEFGRQRLDLLQKTVGLAALFAVAAALYQIARFYAGGGVGRLSSAGALNNPLLISHVFGFFTALWLGWLFTRRTLLPAAAAALLATAPLLLLLILTGSRTPLVAVAATLVWLTVLSGNRKALAFLGLFAVAGGSLIVLTPELITERGLSYRPQVWANVWAQFREQPWFGHGYAAPLSIQLSGIPYPLRDPHNMTLAVLYYGGIVGAALWLGLYGTAFACSLRQRRDAWSAICSATVVYGFIAGMTEGGSFLPRPKEHWFLIWIPLALLTTAIIKREGRDGDVR